jgi:hypothetical protein
MRSLSTLASALVIAALALTAAAAAPAELRIGTSFAASTFGIDSDIFPPDTNGAVGRKHIVELLNGHYAAYRKGNGSRVASASMSQFWNDAGVAPRGFVVDPRVLYDPAADRWYASATSLNSGNGPDELLLAVSRDEDPTRGWVGFSVDFAGPVGNFVDFPMLGMSAEGVFVSTNGSVLVVPKADLLAAQPTLSRASLLQSSALLTPGGTKVQAVVNLDNSAAALLLGTWDVEGSTLRLWRISGTITAPVLDPDQPFVALAPHTLVGPQGALQPESGIGINTSSPFLASSIVLRNGRLWGVQTVDFQGRAALRWFSIDAATQAPVQEGLISDASHDLYMGSIAVDACNDVVIGFNRSGTDQFVSAYAVAGTTERDVTTFGEPVLLRAGVARYESTGGAPTARWGDYSTTVADPQHSRTFWTFQEWPSAQDVWSTQVTELRLQHAGGTCRAG